MWAAYAEELPDILWQLHHSTGHLRHKNLYGKIGEDCVGSHTIPGNITRQHCETFVLGCKCRRLVEEPRQAHQAVVNAVVGPAPAAAPPPADAMPADAPPDAPLSGRTRGRAGSSRR